MSNAVPEGWEIRTLSDLADIDNKSLKNNTDPDYIFRYIDIASVKTAKVDVPTEYVSFRESPSRARKRVHKGDVLMSTVRPNLKSFAYFDVQGDDFVASTGFAVLTANKMSDSNFLYQSILSDSVTRQIESLVAGSNYPAISSANVKSLEVLAPPLPEQQKIATILSSVDDVIEKTRAQIDKLKDLKTGMMQELLTKGIGHTEFKDSPVGRIPESWSVVEIQNIATVVRGASPRPQGDPRFYGGNVPRLMVKDVTRDGKYVTPKIDFLTEAGAKLSRPMPAGTLTIVCSGTVGVPSFLNVNACIHDGFLALKDIASSCDTEFLYYQLLPMQAIFDSSATHGGIFTNLTTQILKEFTIVLPPLSEQQEIAKKLSGLDELLLLRSIKLTKLQFTKKALMQDLLTGKVRVKLTDKESAAV